MNMKRITLAIAILSTLATILLSIEGVLPPQWALVVGSLGAGAYAIVRALQKIAAGASLKSLLSTTEAWGAGLAILGAIVTALAGVVPPHVAVTMGIVAGALLKFARMVQAAKVPGAVPDSEKPTPIEGNPIVRPKDKGSALASLLIWNAVIGLLLCLLLFCATARAETGPQLPADLPGTLGCFDQARDYCGRLVVPAGVGGLSLLTRKVSAGAFVGGVGLGVDLWAKRWYTLTPAIAVAAKAESGANYANIAGMVGVAKVAWVGAMVHVDAALTEWSLLAGIDPITLVAMIKGPPAGAAK